MKCKDKLIIDDGEIRECPKNYAIMGYWGTWCKFFSYKRAIGEYDASEISDAVKLLFNVFIYTLIFPLVPFLHSFFAWRRAVKDVKREEMERLKL